MNLFFIITVHYSAMLVLSNRCCGSPVSSLWILGRALPSAGNGALFSITAVCSPWYCDDKEIHCNKLLADWDNIMTPLHLSAKETLRGTAHPQPSHPTNLIQWQSVSKCPPSAGKEGTIGIPARRTPDTFWLLMDCLGLSQPAVTF